MYGRCSHPPVDVVMELRIGKIFHHCCLEVYTNPLVDVAVDVAGSCLMCSQNYRHFVVICPIYFRYLTTKLSDPDPDPDLDPGPGPWGRTFGAESVAPDVSTAAVPERCIEIVADEETAHYQCYWCHKRIHQ